MTAETKLANVKAILRINDASEDTLIATYLELAAQEILNWRFSYLDTVPDEVPVEYEPTQISAVVAGYSISGAEGQTAHSENGISRTFKYEDMIAYIRSHVIPYARVM